MSTTRAQISISLDGFVAGPDQSRENPLGVGGERLHEWAFPTAAFARVQGREGGEENADSAVIDEIWSNIGAFIMGRNMFGPIRGAWPDESWRGWWGDTPPYHVPVFVLTHHPRNAIEMKGGTTFHFVTDGIHAALQRAGDAAGDKDVRIGGGVATIRQYLQAGLIDELHLAARPILLGAGENLFAGLDLPALGYRYSEHTATELATHVVLTKGAQ